MVDDTSVIICAYTMDRWDELKASVESVRAQIPPSKEIIVIIDNNKILLSRAEREIHGAIIVANNKEPGLSGGRMTGVELASSSIIVFLDDDATAEQGWLAGLLAEYDDDRVLGVGGHIEPNWRTQKPIWFPEEFNWIIGCTYKGLPLQVGKRIRNLMGASMSVRASVLKKSGGFATKLGRREGGGAVLGIVAESCEETEFCIRASRIYPGDYWVHSSTARVHHSVPAQRATWSYFVRRCRMEGTAKAVLTGLTGTKDGLGSERRYVLFLTNSILGELVRGNFRRAAAICAGFTITVAAYARARLARAMVRNAAPQNPTPSTETV